MNDFPPPPPESLREHGIDGTDSPAVTDRLLELARIGIFVSGVVVVICVVLYIVGRILEKRCAHGPRLQHAMLAVVDIANHTTVFDGLVTFSPATTEASGMSVQRAVVPSVQALNENHRITMRDIAVVSHRGYAWKCGDPGSPPGKSADKNGLVVFELDDVDGLSLRVEVSGQKLQPSV